MTAIHTELAAIFGGMNVNEAELKIQYIKYRPSLPYDSKSPITFTIPGNTTPFVSLKDSYLFVQCHVEETDEYGNPSTTDPTCAKRSLNYERAEEEATPPSKTIKNDDEEDPHFGRRENGLCFHWGIAEEEQSGTRQVTVSDVEVYLEEAERRWRKAQRAWTVFHTEIANCFFLLFGTAVVCLLMEGFLLVSLSSEACAGLGNGCERFACRDQC